MNELQNSIVVPLSVFIHKENHMIGNVTSYFICFLMAVILTGFDLHAGGPAPLEMNLMQAVDSALISNPGVAAANWLTESARHKVWEARSGYFPRLSATAGYTAYEKESIVYPIHQPGVFPPLDDQIWESSLQFGMPLFNGGRTRAQVKLSQATHQELQVDRDRQHLNLMQNITHIFLQANELRDQGELMALHLQQLRRRYQEIFQLAGAGRVSPADQALLESALEMVRADSVEISTRQAELANRLGQLLGTSVPVRPIPFDVTSSLTSYAESIFEQYQSFPVSGLMVGKATAQLERTRSSYLLAKKGYWPELSGFALYSYRAGSEMEFEGEWVAGLTLRIPLLEGGRRIAAVKSSQAAVYAAQENLNASQLAESVLLKIARANWESVRTRQSYLTSATHKKTVSVTAMRALYQEGRLALSELLTQETELLQVQIKERAVKYQEIATLLDYQAISGELNRDQIKRIIEE